MSHKDPEKERAYNAKYNAEHREERRAWAATYRRKNKEKIAADIMKWHAECEPSWLDTPDIRGYKLFHNAKSRSKKSKLSFDLSVPWIIEMIIQKMQEAADTGFDFITCERNRLMSASIDRIIPSEGYTRNNIQIVPLWYNLGKRTRSENEMRKAVSAWCDNERSKV